MSYEEEFNALWAWYKKKNREFDTICDRDRAIIRSHGNRDSSLDMIHWQDTHQFNRKLLELKERYNKASVEELDALEKMRGLTDYNAEMNALADWYKQKVLEYFDAIESGRLQRSDLPKAAYTPHDTELERRWHEICKKYDRH